MTTIARADRPSTAPSALRDATPAATAGEATRALVWFLVALAARAPLLCRIEGALDHDQSVVGLMALDIAAGRRWPLFFDGQRYMGAVEAYVAAFFVAIFGHSPLSVALAPWAFFGLFAAGQYLVWSRWADRTTGHLAALVTVLCAPMLALWSIVPRGGYIEILTWALPVLALYRVRIRPEEAPRSRLAQAAWGFLLAFGYFLNPLSLIVYLTMALDWTLGRHGADLRRERSLDGGWLDSRRLPLVWGATAAGLLTGLAVCCHVDFGGVGRDSPFVFLMGWLPGRIAAPLAGLGVAAIVGGAIAWSGAGRRVVVRLTSHPWFTLGMIGALMPFLLNGLLVRWGIIPWSPSLPIWIRAPWDLGQNVRDGGRALGALIGCSPDAAATLLLTQGVELPRHVWPGLARGLARVSPWIVALVAGLIVSVGWGDRQAWQRFWRLRGAEPTRPTVLALLGLGVTTALYLLQATSLDASSMRYLVPAWIVLPGLLASALRRLPRPARVLVAAGLLLSWGTAQLCLWADLDRPSPLRPLVRELERRGINGIVAQTPVALIVANLSHGKIGALEYRANWPRLRDRYASRFSPQGPVRCVVDVDFVCPTAGGGNRAAGQDFGRALRALAARHPTRVRRSWTVSHYEVWEVDLPLSEILDEGAFPLPSRPALAKVAEIRPNRP